MRTPFRAVRWDSPEGLELGERFPRFSPNSEDWCMEQSDVGWFCSREPGHSGVHVPHRSASPGDGVPSRAFGYWVRSD